MAELSDNEFVELVQKDLSRFGFSPGPIDGAAGPLTMAAYDAAIRKLRGTEPEQPPPVGVTLQSELVRLAEAEVGVIENEGENSGERIREYQRASWLDVGAWPWCAAFICWLIREAARVHKVPFSLPQTAGAYDYENWARDNAESGVQVIKPLKNGTIIPGDLVIFKFSHIGLATAHSFSARVHTIEGNTDDPDGSDMDGVFAKHRKLSLVRSIIRLPG